MEGGLEPDEGRARPVFHGALRVRGQHAVLRVHEVAPPQSGRVGPTGENEGSEGARQWNVSAYLPREKRAIQRLVDAPRAVPSAAPRAEVKEALSKMLEGWLNDAPNDSEAREAAAAGRRAARALKAQADQAFGEGDHTRAEELYRESLQRWPGYVMARINLAATQVAQGKLRAAAWECKRAVAAVRADEAEGGVGEAEGGAGGAGCDAGTEVGGSPGEVAARAYARLAHVYAEQKRWVRAGNALVLALRSATPGSGCDPLPPSPRWSPLQQQLVRQLKRLQAKTDGGGGGEDEGAASSAAAPGAGVPDIEDAVSSHWLLRRSDPFSFACTGCGECCRTSDHILLSPFDLWRMTRSPDAHLLLGAPVTTTALRRRFSGALHFSSQHGVPVCSLRPRQQASGRCAFSFPLWEAQEGGDGAAPRVLSFREAFHEGLIEEEGEENGEGGEEPVHPSEYTLTEEDLASEQSGDGDEEGDEEGEDEEGDDGASEDSEDSEELRDLVPEAASREGSDSGDTGPKVSARRNRAGRQALGCSLGAAGMPTMCASYPVARELSWADFWHAHEEGAAARSRMVVVHNDACEGFGAGAEAEAAAVFGHGKAPAALPGAGQAPGERPSQSGGASVGAEEAERGGGQTVAGFVQRNGLDARWNESERFFARCLRPAASSPAVRKAMREGGERQRVVWAALASAWYDFDGDRPANCRSRGGSCASWPATRRGIEHRTQQILVAVGGAQEGTVEELERSLAGAGSRPSGAGPAPASSV